MKALRHTSLYAAALVATLTILPACAAEVNPALKQNADLLQTIMRTAFKDNEAARLASLQYSYLRGQGLLFQANAIQGSHRVFHFHDANVPIAPVPPLPNGEFDFEFDSQAIEQLAESARDMAEQMTQQHRQIRRVMEEKRDIERELRDIEREKREIEFNKSLSKLDKEQQKALDMLQQKSSQLQKKLAEVEKTAELNQKEMAQQRSKLQAEQQQKTAAMLKTVGEKFSQILCDYGASLRDIPDNEYVTLQVNSRLSEGRHYWIVKKADINQCMAGKIKAADLLTKAITYQF
jgi:chaperonin cofactor prefoldin